MVNTGIPADSFKKLVIEKYINEYNEKAKNDSVIVNDSQIAILTQRQSFSVLQFQPSEELIVDQDKGIYSNNMESYIKKYNSFLDLSFKETYALVLTPEYSVPSETLKYLINNKDNIRIGSIYCMCCEGMTYDNYCSLMEELREMDIVVNDDLLNSVVPDNLVCVLFYVTKIKFNLKNRNSLEIVFLVPQFKLNQMRDPEFLYETYGLTLGNRLLYFGDENGPKFLSVLCADSYNLNVIQKLQEFGSNNLLVFNPQLNMGADNSIFKLMRENLFEYCKGNTQMISLNWAKGTKLKIENYESKLSSPRSGYLFEFQRKDLDKIYKVYPKNTYWGFDFFCDNSIGCWAFATYESVVSYNISSFNTSATPRFASNNFDLVAKKLWIYNETFIENEKTCQNSIDTFFKENKEFEQLIVCSDCSKDECSKCKINEFSASVFDKSIIEEYDILNNWFYDFGYEKNNRTIEKIIICKKIINMINEGNVSPRFRILDKNIKFVVQKKHDLSYNIVFIDNDSTSGVTNIPCRIVFLPYTERHLAIEKYNHLSEKYGEENKTDIMVFYESEKGCKVIPEDNDTSILNDNQTETNNEIIQ